MSKLSKWINPLLLSSAALFGAPDAAAATPQVALVIDDLCDGHPEETTQIANLPGPLTLAFLPYADSKCLTQETAHAHKNGHEVIAHLPMQPKERSQWAPKGQINVGMPVEKIVKTVKDAMDSVPYSIGFNNHQGSVATTDATTMKGVALAVWDNYKVGYVLDARTTADTKLCDAMRDFNISCKARSFPFLDNDLDPKAIRAQLQKAVEESRETGKPVVVIGHHHPETISVLEQELPKIKKYMIPVSSVPNYRP